MSASAEEATSPPSLASFKSVEFAIETRTGKSERVVPLVWLTLAWLMVMLLRYRQDALTSRDDAMRKWPDFPSQSESPV